MARTKISSLKQLHTALRSLSIAEFMRLSPHGRSAYGALFDELDVEDEMPELPAPAPRRLPSSPPVPAPGQVSVFPPGEGFKHLQPVSRVEDVPGWARALVSLGFDSGLAEDALLGRREVWVKGDTRTNMEAVGFTFDPGESARVGNVHADVYAA